MGDGNFAGLRDLFLHRLWKESAANRTGGRPRIFTDETDVRTGKDKSNDEIRNTGILHCVQDDDVKVQDDDVKVWGDDVKVQDDDVRVRGDDVRLKVTT